MIETSGRPVAILGVEGWPVASGDGGASGSGDRTETAAALRQDRKVDALGSLVAGLAHDFNNLLGVIIGNLDRANRLTPIDATASRYIVDASSATERAVTLVCRLLAFARAQPIGPTLVEIDGLLTGLKPLLDIAAQGCVVTLHLGRVGFGLIEADQLENAIINLAVNAQDAMPNGGTLAITTWSTMWESIDAGGSRTTRDCVGIQVRDTGTGMSPEVRARVGERFFTTKAEGRGTGLGLAQVRGFVDRSGGKMELTSELGQGTCVTLYIPSVGIASA